MPKVALITGIMGQDGAYLTRHLLNQGYIIWGARRRSSQDSQWRLEELGILGDVQLIDLDLLEMSNIIEAIRKTEPDEIYNLAAQSYVAVSFSQPVYTSQVNAISPTYLLESIRVINPKIKFYQASTSELYGHVFTRSQDEDTPFDPVSPYGISKQSAFWYVDNYRRSYGLFGCNGILFNHESPRRGEEFVTRKVTKYVGSYTENSPPLELGNLDAVRDWGHARDYVKGMWLMLQQEYPTDYVLATGTTHTIREMVELCFRVELNKDIEWSGEGKDEIGTILTGPNQRTRVVKVNPAFYRPSEVGYLCGDSSRAAYNLNWKREYTFKRLMSDMLRNDSYNPEAFKYGGSSDNE